MNTCIMLEDFDYGRIMPQSLENILNYFKQEGIALTKPDIVMIFVYILMLETGFVSEQGAPSLSLAYSHNFNLKQILLLTKSFPKDWKQNVSYILKFTIFPSVTYFCTIAGIYTADDLIINCSVKDLPEANFSLLLDPSMYVLSATQYQNLKQLSIKFKDSVSYPLKLLIFEQLGFASISFKCMPLEILWNIFKFCDKQSLKNLSKTSDFFQKVIEDGKFLSIMRVKNVEMKPCKFILRHNSAR